MRKIDGFEWIALRDALLRAEARAEERAERRSKEWDWEFQLALSEIEREIEEKGIHVEVLG